MSSLWYLFNAAIKGIIEGFTEFLPISSTGHLVLVRSLFPLAENPVQAKRLEDLFDIIIQFPAVLAVAILFRKRLWQSVATLHEDRLSRRFWLSLIIAFIPLAVVGILLKKDIENYLMAPVPVAVALIIGGIILLCVEKAFQKSEIHRAEDVPPPTAFQIGLIQCLALIPGTSRSGATIIGGRLRGLTRTAAAEFSFFLALPVMTAAFGFKMLKEYSTINWAHDGPILLMGCVTAFITAWIVVSVFIRFLEKNSLAVFGWYRIVLGVLVLAYAAKTAA